MSDLKNERASENARKESIMRPTTRTPRGFIGLYALVLATVPAASIVGCNGPHGEMTGSGVISTSSADDGTSTTGAADTTGSADAADETGGTGGGGGFSTPCSFDGMLGAYESLFDAAGSLQVPLNEVEHEIVAGDVCDDVPELAPLADHPLLGEDGAYNVYVYRPYDSATNWPSEPQFPVVFYSPGIGHAVVQPNGTPDLTDADTHYYSHLFEPLSEDGHIVVAIQAPVSVSSETRRKLMACTMIWARDEWSEAARVSTSAVLMGHSRGGSAVNNLVDTLYDTDDDGEFDDLTPGSAVDDYEICASVAIAQRWGPDESPLGGDTKTDVDIDNTDAPPALSLLGARDNDTRVQQVSMFDMRVQEESIAQGGDSDPGLDTHPEAMVMVYGAQHNAWGGIATIPQGGPAGVEIAHATGPHYLREFLRWHVLGEIAGRQAFADLTDPTLTEADLPASFAGPNEWTDDCDLCPFYDGCQVAGATCDGPPAVPSTLAGLGRPVIYAALTEGHFSGGADRFVVDTLTRAQSGSGTALGDSTLGGPVQVVSGGVGAATWDWAPNLTSSLGLVEWNGHQSSAVRLDWGGDSNDVQLLWSLEDADGLALAGVAGLGAYTHVSLRIGNVVEGDENCDDVQTELSFDEVEGDLRLHYRDTSGVEQTTAWTSIGLLVDPQRPYQQDAQSQFDLNCDAVQFMHTVRLPLADFCETDGLSVENLSGVELRLHDKGVTQHAIVDSIEFTRDPTAAETATCPTKTSGWNCYAASTFTATETSCKDEPTPGCAGKDIVTNPVDPPWVDNPGAGGFDGWVVHMPAGSKPLTDRPARSDRVVV